MADDPMSKAQAAARSVYEGLCFELEANRRQVAVSMERELSLRAMRRQAAELYRKAGGDPADLGATDDIMAPTRAA